MGFGLLSFTRFTCKPTDFRSGAEGIRTPDLRRAKAALSQLSYGPDRGSWGEFTAVVRRGLMAHAFSKYAGSRAHGRRAVEA
jgi:hypothetical protein